MPRFDQLTLVRNHVRKVFETHQEDVDGDGVDEVEVDVAWLDGTVDTLIFDKNVGFPIDPVLDWYSDWRKEVNE